MKISASPSPKGTPNGLPNGTPTRRFSPHSDEVFHAPTEVEYLVGEKEWPDFYAILEIPRDLSTDELTEAITDLATQVLTASLSRGGGLRIRLAARYLPLLRPILLDTTVRASYDAQYERHLHSDVEALEFESWRAQNFSFSTRLKQKSQSWWTRVRQNALQEPYL